MATVSKRFNAKNGISVGTQPVNVIDTDGTITTREVVIGGNNNFTTSIIASDVLTSNTTFRLPSSTGATGQVLKTNGLGTLYWENVTSTTTTLDDLTDVVVTNPEVGHVVVFDGTNWVNSKAKIYYQGVLTVQPTETKVVDTIDLIGSNITSRWQLVITCSDLSYVQTFDLHALIRVDTNTAKWTKVAILGDNINMQVNMTIAGAAANLNFVNNEASPITVEYIRLST